jgi:hypothetical protein
MSNSNAVTRSGVFAVRWAFPDQRFAMNLSPGRTNPSSPATSFAWPVSMVGMDTGVFMRCLKTRAGKSAMVA